MLCSITDYSDPKERMVAGIRYFLSSFHCARQVRLSLYEFIPCISHSQGTIPKKPYNPILGEIFRCYWDLPDGNRVAPTAEAKVLVTTGHGISDSIIDIIT